MARRLARGTASVPLRPVASRRPRPGSLSRAEMDTQRLILLVIFSFSLLMLWEAWEKEKRPKPAPAVEQTVPAPGKPAAPAAASPAVKAPAVVPGTATPAKGETVRVRTDLVVAEIDTLGATLKRLELLRH